MQNYILLQPWDLQPRKVAMFDIKFKMTPLCWMFLVLLSESMVLPSLICSKCKMIPSSSLGISSPTSLRLRLTRGCGMSRQRMAHRRIGPSRGRSRGRRGALPESHVASQKAHTHDIHANVNGGNFKDVQCTIFRTQIAHLHNLYPVQLMRFSTEISPF